MAVDDAVGSIFAASYQRLVGQVLAACADQQRAEEAVQEAFVRAIRLRRGLASVPHPEAWLRGAAFDHVRRPWQRLAALPLRSGRVPGPVHPLDLGPAHAETLAALQGLPAHVRHAGALRDAAELAPGVIAQELEVPLSTVNRWLSRAPDVRGLGDLGRTVVPPDIASLEEVARSRRRARPRVLGAAAASAVAVAALLAGPGVEDDRVRPTPTPSIDPDQVERWTPDDIVAHPDSAVVVSVNSTDPEVRLASVPDGDADGWVVVWHRCAGTASRGYVDACPASRSAVAVEVWGGSAAPLLVRLPETPVIRYVGDGTFFVGGYDRGPDLLVKAGWTEAVRLDRTASKAPARPGLEIVPCAGPRPCVLDASGARLTPVDVPVYPYATWSSDTARGLWGVAGDSGPDTVVYQVGSGTFREHPVPRARVLRVPANVPEGVLAVYYARFVIRNVPILDRLHVSTDQGQTWRTLRVPVNLNGSLDRRWYLGYDSALPQGWESWRDAED